MEGLPKLLLFLSIIAPSFASENGKYYVCDEATLASDNKCIFALSGDEPEEWVPLEQHNIDREIGPDFYRGVEKYDGSQILGTSPLPWANGDRLVSSGTTKISGDDWSGYTLIFELMAPLRDMMMYRPDDLDQETWDKWTRALTDCNAKTVDYEESRGGAQLSTKQVYDVMKNPNYKDVHHNLLQYLEEGSIDLVCLSTDLEMSHCDVTRGANNAVVGDHCNCWFDAYQAIYGVCPVVDTEFKHCDNTVAPTVCTDTTPNAPADDGGENEMPSPPDMPSPPEKPSGPPA